MTTTQDAHLPKLPRRRGLVLNLIGQLALGLLVATIILPSTQEWPVLFGESQAAVQLTFSLYVVAFGLSQLIYGPVSDRIGRRKVLLFGLAVVVLGATLAALATRLDVLVVARLIQGIGCAAGMVVGRAMVQDLFAGPERTRIMAFVGMAMGMVPPLATVVGGHLYVHLGWQSNFVLVALLASSLFVAAWRGLPAHVAHVEVQPHWLRAMGSAYARLGREPVFLLYVVIASMTTAPFYSFLAAAPIVLGHYGVGPDGVGIYIMIGPLSYIVGSFLTSRLAHRVRGLHLMWLGQLLAVASVVVITALALLGRHTPLAFALPMILMGLGHGLLVPPALAGTIGLVPALAGSAAAITGLSQQMLGACGGFVVGLVSNEDATSVGLLMLFMALLGVAAQLALQRCMKSPESPGHRA